MPAVAFSILQAVIIRAQGRDSELRKALGADWKGKVSIVAYMLAIVLAFVDPRLPLAVYVLIALLWLVPDRRIENWVRQSCDAPDQVHYCGVRDQLQQHASEKRSHL